MTDSSGAGSGAAPSKGNGDGAGSSDARYAELRQLLVGPEEAQLRLLQQRLDDPVLHAEDVSRIIAEAVELRRGRDTRLRRVLLPIIEEAISLSVQRDPSVLSSALFPIIGSAIRKAVSSALKGMIESLNQTLEQSFSFRGFQWRFEALRTGRSFGEILLLRSQLYQIEQVFLIHKQTGLLLHHLSSRDVVVKDADLVSGMLTAIQDFVRDSFGPAAGEDLEVMQVGEFNLWIQHGSRALLACLVRGVPPRELKHIFQLALTRIEDQFWRQLDEFDGDASALAPAQPFLEPCLLGKLGEHPQPRHVGRWIFAASASLLFALFVFLAANRQRRWDTYVRRVASEPGIVVTSSESHWGSYLMAGLRDPLAADPAQLLADSGIPPGKVAFRWEPYQSLQPTFLSIRRYQTLKDWIESQSVFFELSSSYVDADLLRPVARNLLELNQSAEIAGKRFQVRIEGRTDPPGATSQNRKLAQDRAAAVLSELVRQGVPPARLVTSAVPRSPAASGLEPANSWDRRVSFRLLEP
ncbi:MAG: OmpA family protein [Bryobacterales bacterium]|nr:OmpA family protein [Bryobacterales bacterium]